MNRARCSTLATAAGETAPGSGRSSPSTCRRALGTKHTIRVPSRYNPAQRRRGPPFPILYLAENHQVALFEVGALLGFGPTVTLSPIRTRCGPSSMSR